jgi:hypothetical protein
MQLASVSRALSREDIFSTICELAQINVVLPSRAAIPYLDEPWYC